MTGVPLPVFVSLVGADGPGEVLLQSLQNLGWVRHAAHAIMLKVSMAVACGSHSCTRVPVHLQLICCPHPVHHPRVSGEHVEVKQGVSTPTVVVVFDR
jgi:hypothetical protein